MFVVLLLIPSPNIFIIAYISPLHKVYMDRRHSKIQSTCTISNYHLFFISTQPRSPSCNMAAYLRHAEICTNYYSYLQLTVFIHFSCFYTIAEGLNCTYEILIRTEEIVHRTYEIGNILAEYMYHTK